jgi:hypothetical protein
MGGMVMGECENKQRKFCIVQTNCKHLKGGYGILTLGDVYRCHGFLPRMCKFEKVDFKTFFHKLIEGCVNRRFGNPYQPFINKICGTQSMILCNFKHVS